MEDNSSFEILFENVCLNALKSFSLDEFREIKQKALKEIVLGKDVLVILPTGSGKSLIFQTAPLVFDEMSGSSGEIVIVISPLVSLMKDQMRMIIVVTVYNNKKSLGQMAKAIATTTIRGCVPT
ncbi:ATP-dependent DNA helicase RecQ [Exaiptasia diaphana]|nr:ATP-dependent DNA helicase RecQ [Exaiptasia diaphana]